MNTEQFALGEIIFQEGDSGDRAYLVESGTVEISRMVHGDKRFIAELQRGDLFGEVALIDQAPRSATAIATTPVELIAITADQLQDRIKNADPILAMLVNILLVRYRAAIDPSRVIPTAPDNRYYYQIAAANQRAAFDKMRLESELKQALEGSQLDVFFQPLFDNRAGYWAGFEALVRWRHPERGLISPAEFISIAEETTLIAPLGFYVLEQALGHLQNFQALRDRHSPDRAPLFMGINISARQFDDPSFFDKINRTVERFGLNPQSIKLEITESLIVDYPKVVQWVEQCRNTGYSIALDDFGTGYSTMEQLLSLDFDTLKIDQTFVKGLFASKRARPMINGMIGLAKGLDMKIVAEGIETQEHQKLLSELGVDYAQGYYIDKPLDAEIVRKRIIEDGA